MAPNKLFWINFRVNLFATLIFLLTPLPANASNEPIQINADYMQIDVNTGNSVYKGNVNFVQGDTKLAGEKITVISKNDAIEQIEVEGTPATYRYNDKQGNAVDARSQFMEYSINDARLIMLEDARLEQNDQIIESQRIVYDTDKRVVLAGNDTPGNDTPGSEAGERVNITISPTKKQEKR